MLVIYSLSHMFGYLAEQRELIRRERKRRKKIYRARSVAALLTYFPHFFFSRCFFFGTP